MQLRFMIASMVFLLTAPTISVFFQSRQDDGILAKSVVIPIERELKVSVELGRYEFKRNEKTQVVVRISNSGESAVSILKDLGWGRSSSLSYTISDRYGRTVFKTTLPDAQDMPPFRRDAFIELRKGESATRKRWLDAYSEGLRRPGKYKLTVYFHSPVPREWAPEGLVIWAMDDGPVKSPDIEFTILKQR